MNGSVATSWMFKVLCSVGLSLMLSWLSAAAAQTGSGDTVTSRYFSARESDDLPTPSTSGKAVQGENDQEYEWEADGNGAEREPVKSEEAAQWRAPDEPRKIEAEFGEGFSLVSEDEEFELTFHILNQVDYKLFSPSDQDPAAIDGVYIPRMRIYFEGKLADPFRYEVSLQRSVEGAFDLLDANLDVRLAGDRLQLRFGRSLIPYSYTWYDHLEQYFIAPERPLFPLNFGLARAAGLQIWGNDALRRWQYSVGAYDGRLAGLADNSTTTDVASYLNFRPYAVSRAGGFLENLNIGGSLVLGQTERPEELLPLKTSIQASENDEASVAASAVFLEFNPDVVALGDPTLGAVHAAWYGGSVSLETEWNSAQIEFLNEATDESVDVVVNGFHVSLATFLTGEQVRGREVVQPLRPFDPRCGWTHRGAFEPFVRYSYLYLGDEIFDRGLADEADWTNEVSMTDLGLNWYLNRYTKFVFNWQHAAYASPVLVNETTGQMSDRNDLYWFRCQFYF